MGVIVREEHTLENGLPFFPPSFEGDGVPVGEMWIKGAI